MALFEHRYKRFEGQVDRAVASGILVVHYTLLEISAGVAWPDRFY